MQELKENEVSILEINFVLDEFTKEGRARIKVNNKFIPQTKLYRLNYFIKDFVNNINNI